MGKVNVQIEKNDLNDLRQGKIPCAGLLKKYLPDRSSGTFKQICEELQAYYKDEGGSPVVSKFEIIPKDCSYDTTSGKGKVRLKYAVQYHFGCSDLSPVTDIAETCDFSIDEESNILAVFIPDKVIRDTVDEF